MWNHHHLLQKSSELVCCWGNWGNDCEGRLGLQKSVVFFLHKNCQMEIFITSKRMDIFTDLGPLALIQKTGRCESNKNFKHAYSHTANTPACKGNKHVGVKAGCWKLETSHVSVVESTCTACLDFLCQNWDHVSNVPTFTSFTNR